MAKIDLIRRECQDLGTLLPKDATEARAAIAAIQTKADGPEAEPTLLAQQLDAFRAQFKVDPAVAAYRTADTWK